MENDLRSSQCDAHRDTHGRAHRPAPLPYVDLLRSPQHLGGQDLFVDVRLPSHVDLLRLEELLLLLAPLH